MRELLRDREFLAYFAARQGAQLGYSIETVAIGWQIYGLRHQPLDIGLVGLVLFVPQLLLALPAGTLADRFDRRIVCVACACGEVVAELVFVGLVLTGSRSLPVNLAAVGLIGIAHTLGGPAERALLAGIVRSERFVRAQAMTTSVGEVVTIVGPALGGVLIAVGVPVAFGAAAAAYALAALAFSFLAPRPTEEQALEPGAAIAGLRFVLHHPVILGAISLDLFAVLFGGATALLPVYATQILHAADLARHPIARRAGPLLLWCVAGFGAATIVFAVSHNLVLSLLALAATGGFDIVSVVIRTTLVQLDTPNAMRGRVSAIENIFIGASYQLGAFESGVLEALVGTVASVAIGGVATLAVIALWAILFPALRAYDRIGDGESASAPGS